MKNLMQKLWNSHFIKNELKISSSEEICHVALNKNEFKTMNNLFVDNDSNSSSNNDFMSTVLFIHSAFSVAIFDVTAHQDKK